MVILGCASSQGRIQGGPRGPKPPADRKVPPPGAEGARGRLRCRDEFAGAEGACKSIAGIIPPSKGKIVLSEAQYTALGRKMTPPEAKVPPPEAKMPPPEAKVPPPEAKVPPFGQWPPAEKYPGSAPECDCNRKWAPAPGLWLF